jgi:uncharacterized membrane protein (DUF2068 family)
MDSSRRTINAIAFFEAFKGLLALCAASGLLLFVHRDLHELAVRLVEHAHLNPAARYPQIFLDAATHMQESQLVLIAAGAAAYASVRFVEAYGLFYGRAWAEVIAAASGAIYVPFELERLARQPTWLSVAIVAVNVAIVVVMVRALLQRRQQRNSF